MSGPTEELRAPAVADIDARLLAGAGPTVLMQVIADHDTAPDSWCPRCRWWVGRPGHRSCPSRALARAIKARRPVPGWLLHLVDDVSGARAPIAPVPIGERWAAEDAMPGLFDAPPREIAKETRR